MKRSSRLRKIAFSLFVPVFAVALAPLAADPAGQNASPSPTPLAPTVLSFTIVKADKAARILRDVYPHASIRIARASNSVIIMAPQAEVDGMRLIATGIDVKNPTDASIEAIPLHAVRPEDLLSKIRPLFRDARIQAAPNHSLLVAAPASELTQIKAVIAAIDVPPPSPTPKPAFPTVAVRVLDAEPKSVARAVARSAPSLRVAVDGGDVLLSGPPDDISAAKAMIAQLDVPEREIRYTEVYRLRTVDAESVARLFGRSFPDAIINVDKDLNALTVLATASLQQRVADAASQLDAPANSQGQGGGPVGGGALQTEVMVLRAAVPAVGGAASTSANDIAQTVTQALAASAPDLKITVHPNSTRLVLTGSTYSLRLARDLITKLDVAEPLVELDTEVYEIDEGVQKQLGLRFPTAALSTTYTEIIPIANAAGVTPPLAGLQKLSRTPLTLSAELDFLIATNKAKILEDPRITTFSGRTASLRAGETVNILTTTGGGTGTVATTQVQSFQTGVTLDITPVVNTGKYVTLTLHPSVNTEAGISSAGVPNIQTRDTTTTVGLRDGQTLVVGGLIEDSNSRTVQKIPFLGDLPLIGKLFQDVGVNHTRNELVVTVTPHIIHDGAIPTTLDSKPSYAEAPVDQQDGATQISPLIDAPMPVALPAIPSSATLPPASRVRTATKNATQELADVQIAGSPTASPSAAPAPAIVATPPAGPIPEPSAFGQMNVYTFGSAPTNNYADSSQPPQIFFAQVQPSVVKNGQPIAISVITTTNVSNVSFGVSAQSSQASLGNAGAGKWQSTFNFSSAGLSAISGSVTMQLTATTSLGAKTSIKVPLALVSE